MSICIITCWCCMGKINLLVKYCLINEENEYNIKGILINNKIKFLDNDEKMILDKKLNTLKRITKESEILFNFKDKSCLICDKTNNKISFQIEVLVLENNDDYFYVKYKIIDDLFEIMIKII